MEWASKKYTIQIKVIYSNKLESKKKRRKDFLSKTSGKQHIKLFLGYVFYIEIAFCIEILKARIFSLVMARIN
jgi:hypothetical protein